MHSKLKHLLCLMTLGIFLFLGLASGILDESTNVSVRLKPSDCAARPPFTGTLEVKVINPGQSGFPSSIEVHMGNQKINDTTECISFYRHDITQTGLVFAGSTETFTSPSFTHDNKGDLWRVQIRAKLPGDEEWSAGEVKVVFYDQTQVTFTLGTLPPL